MDALSLADIARVTAEDFRRGREELIGLDLVRELAVAMELALLTAVHAERRACAAECNRRSALWQATADRSETPELLRAEARCRGNEAAYLADLLAART